MLVTWLGTSVRPYTKGKLLVLGGTGFVGSNICERGVEAGFEVVSVSRRGTPADVPPGRAYSYSHIAPFVIDTGVNPRFVSQPARGKHSAATSSTRMLNLRFLSETASYDVASKSRQALAAGSLLAKVTWCVGDATKPDTARDILSQGRREQMFPAASSNSSRVFMALYDVASKLNARPSTKVGSWGACTRLGCCWLPISTRSPVGPGPSPPR
jgi:hypothetical protein